MVEGGGQAPSPRCSKPVTCSTQPDAAHESFWISKLLHSPLLLPINNLPFTLSCRKQTPCSLAAGRRQQQQQQSNQRRAGRLSTVRTDVPSKKKKSRGCGASQTQHWRKVDQRASRGGSKTVSTR